MYGPPNWCKRAKKRVRQDVGLQEFGGELLEGYQNQQYYKWIALGEPEDIRAFALLVRGAKHL